MNIATSLTHRLLSSAPKNPAAADPAAWRAAGEWITFDGLRLFTALYGTGKPVLVLHGFPTASYDFSRVVPLLSTEFRFVLFDYPGFGFSDKPRDYPYSLFRYADAAKAVAAHYGLDRMLLLAHDIGDSVALEVLRRGQPVIEKLVLLNGSVYSIALEDRAMLISQRLFLHRISGPIMSRLVNHTTFARLFAKLFHDPLPAQEMGAFWSLVHNQDGNRLYHRLMGYMIERWEHQYIWLDALTKHRAPLTLVWGQADPVATPAVADVIAERRPDASDIRLQHIAHYPHWEAPQAVADAVRRAFSV
jgi:pimeloyl-ACP methyl ester carboxylesterase